MKQENYKSVAKVFVLSIIVIVLAIVFCRLLDVYSSAYYYKHGKNPEFMKWLGEGKTESLYNPKTDKITIFIDKNSSKYEEVLKHELCHREQNLKGRLAPSDNLWGSFLNEIECYIKQKK